MKTSAAALKVIWISVQIVLYGFQIVVATGFIYLYLTRSQYSEPHILSIAKQIIKKCAVCEDSGNVLTYALQLDRLDFVSMSLTLLGVVIALFGFVGFWLVRREALQASYEACTENLPKATSDWLNAHSDPIIAKHISNLLPEALLKIKASKPISSVVGSKDNEEADKYQDIAKSWNDSENSAQL